MIDALRIPKQWGTYTDTYLTLGLARLLYMVQLQLFNRKKIDIVDAGTEYVLKMDSPINPEIVANELTYESMLKPVRGNKTEAIPGLDWSEVPFFDTQENTELRNRWKEYQRQSKQQKEKFLEEVPLVPDARTQNGVVLTSMRHDRNHNKLWKSELEVKEDFGPLAASILKAFSMENESVKQNIFDKVAKQFKEYTGKKLPAPASAIKIFVPTLIQGVNQVKADTNKISGSSTQESWVMLWLVAAGLFEFGFSERVKVAERIYDWRVLSLQPTKINLSSYRSALDGLRNMRLPSSGYGIARFDAEVVLSFSDELLHYHPASEINRPVSRRSRSPSLKELVSGFSGTHFGSKGQVYGVQSIFNLGIPDWIRPNNAEEVKAYRKLIDEHLALVRSLSVDEGQGELLSAYRNFITGNDLEQFFRFNCSYCDYIVKQLANPKTKYPPKQFSKEGLDTMAQSFNNDRPISDITNNIGFQRIARAINSSTVYAGKIQTKKGSIELDWQRTYGLAQRLGNQAGSKKDFVTELTAFLTSYGNENVRLSEQLRQQGKTLKRVSITNVDLEQFFSLLDEFPCSLVANLLLAYGYARWKKPLQEEPKDTLTVEDDAEITENSNKG